MAKQLLAVAAFLTVLIVGDRLGGFLLGTVLDNSKIPIAQMYAGRSESEVLLLGNSRAYRHFDTKNLSREFGRPVTNLANPGISTLASLALLEDFIDIYGAPKIVLIELSGLVADQEASAKFRPFSPRSERISELLWDTHPHLYYAGRISHLFNFNNIFFLNAAHKVFFPMPDLLFQSALSEPIAADTIAAWQRSYFNTKPENVTALIAIIDVAERHGIKLQLVISPILPAFAERNGYLAWRDEISAALGDTRIWDYGKGPPLMARFFKDPVHLNVRGVKVFMGLLRRDGFFTRTGWRAPTTELAPQTDSSALSAKKQPPSRPPAVTPLSNVAQSSLVARRRL